MLVGLEILLGALTTIIGTKLWNERELAKAIEIEQRLGNAQVPAACFQFPKSFYTNQAPENLCVWVEDDIWQDGGCWKMKDKDLCWTRNGWRYHE